jgi:hypothetical protein
MQALKITNVAELRLRVGSTGTSAELQGYYLAGDGGGGEFYWDSLSVLADNGGTIFQVSGVTTGRWIRKVNNSINVRWFGAKGDNTFDDTVIIQTVIDYCQLNSLIVLFGDGVFLTTASLIVNKDNTTIEGYMSSKQDGGVLTEGTVINYTGAGTAIIVGKAVSVSGAFISGINISNLKIELAQGSFAGMRVWHALRSTFDKITFWGNEGAANRGLIINAGVDNLYSRIEVSGFGRSGNSNTALYLGAGIECALGFGNDLITTTVIRDCYFHYCRYAALVAYFVRFENTIFESSNYGIVCTIDSQFQLDQCWFENNSIEDIYFANAKATITRCYFQAYTRQRFLNSGNGVQSLVIRDSEFETGHVAPFLFAPGLGENIFNTVLTDNIIIELVNNKYPLGTKVGGTYNEAVGKYVRIDYQYRYTAGELLLNVVSALTATTKGATLASTTGGFLNARMTTAQKVAIVGPTAGLVVYDTTLNKLCIFTTVWETITSI